MSEHLENVAGAFTYATALLRGDRVRLRAMREADLDQLVAWRQDPTQSILQQPAVTPPSEDASRGQFRTWLGNAGPDVDATIGFCVEALDSGELLGHTSLFAIDRQARSATFAISLRPDRLGGGHGSDATRVMTRYGFRELGLHRIDLRAWAFNERAVAAYRRVGFVVEGRRREAVFHDGRWYDEVIMGLLTHEA